MKVSIKERTADGVKNLNSSLSIAYEVLSEGQNQRVSEASATREMPTLAIKKSINRKKNPNSIPQSQR